MDTRFWGPDGWKLLHSIAYNYPSNPNNSIKQKYQSFFNSLPYVLPCVYCRNSLHNFFKELPIKRSLTNDKSLFKWLYDIHNKVNDKLRIQCLNKKRNPSLMQIRNFYKKYTEKNNKMDCNDTPGIGFIYSIVFNYPLTKDNFKTKIRFNRHITFLKLLAELYPFQKFKIKYKEIIQDTDLGKILSKRTLFKRWFYKVDKTINKKCLSYKDRCEYIELYRASCKKKTCRKKP